MSNKNYKNQEKMNKCRHISEIQDSRGNFIKPEIILQQILKINLDNLEIKATEIKENEVLTLEHVKKLYKF